MLAKISSRFLIQRQTSVGKVFLRLLYYFRILTSTEEDDTDSAPSSMSTAFFNISVDVRYSNHKMSGVVCVKRGPVVEAEKALSTQLRLMTLSEGRNMH